MSRFSGGWCTEGTRRHCVDIQPADWMTQPGPYCKTGALRLTRPEHESSSFRQLFSEFFPSLFLKNRKFKNSSVNMNSVTKLSILLSFFYQCYSWGNSFTTLRSKTRFLKLGSESQNCGVDFFLQYLNLFSSLKILYLKSRYTLKIIFKNDYKNDKKF